MRRQISYFSILSIFGVNSCKCTAFTRINALLFSRIMSIKDKTSELVKKEEFQIVSLGEDIMVLCIVNDNGENL